MAITNRDRVGKTLDLLSDALKVFVVRELKAVHGERWRYAASDTLRDHHFTEDGTDLVLDTQALFLIMWDQWKTVFQRTLGHSERNYVSELRDVRNKWAHQHPFSTDDAYRTLDTAERLLNAISAAEQAAEVRKMKHDLLRLSQEEQARNVVRKAAASAVNSATSLDLPAWRDIVTPHPDVASGDYQNAEFAADLGQAHRDEGPDEYRDPRAFFRRTYLTYGLSQLLTGALKRLNGLGGDPVVELQTNFGGGKTHSLLALYHLFSNIPAVDLPGLEPVLEAANCQPMPARRAVLVGHALSPATPRPTPDGCVVNTLWGELAWQLLGRDGYELVASADQSGISPGTDVLRQLFERAAPCLVLIDEWVVYARQLYKKDEALPGGSFDANLSFAQSLTEAAKVAPRTLVVITIPASDDRRDGEYDSRTEIEIGGQGGREATIRLTQIVGRIESPWRPADRDESFEIVRRRLFDTILDYPKRDAVAKTFAQLYQDNRQEFPRDCHEAEYERRLKAAYPIHPELFDRLFTDWSGIGKFQRTRGVLRLMAAIIHELWAQQDRSPLIMPANLPLDVPEVQSLFIQYLEDNWVPIIEKDVDGDQALSLRIDNGNPNFGRIAAARRVARTIFFGSVPTLNSTNKGIEIDHIKLGCALPGQNVAIYGDVLRRLTGESTYLYQSETRYWYATQQSVTRLAQERAAQYSDETIYDEIIKEYLRAGEQAKSDFAKVYICINSGDEIEDRDHPVAHSARLVIMKPQHTHSKGDTNSQAQQEATAMLNQRGNVPRSNRNTLVFLAPDRNNIEDLKQTARLHKAWKSIVGEREELNLDAFQHKQAAKKVEETHKTILLRLPQVYVWLLVPEQADGRTQSDQVAEIRLQPQWDKDSSVASANYVGQLATDASYILRKKEMLVLDMAGWILRQQYLDRIPLWSRNSNHVLIKDLLDAFAKYMYLPRLKHSSVLLNAIRTGLQSLTWEQETFAYADGWDEARQRYINLRAGQLISITESGLLVKPDVAIAQMLAERLAQEEAEQRRSQLSTTLYPHKEQASPVVVERNGTLTHANTHSAVTVDEPPHIPKAGEPEYHRFHGSVQLEALRVARHAGEIMDEVIKHLVGLNGADVQVTLEIQAKFPESVPDHIVRTVTENYRVLRFDNSTGFEED
jgi:predicted AAA+ superfamily ATPase